MAGPAEEPEHGTARRGIVAAEEGRGRGAGIGEER